MDLCYAKLGLKKWMNKKPTSSVDLVCDFAELMKLNVDFPGTWIQLKYPFSAPSYSRRWFPLPIQVEH